MERIERYGDNGIDLDFQQIAVTANDVRSGRLVSHEANTADSNFKRLRDECLREGLDPYEAVKVEALSPGMLRDRLDAAIERQVRDVHQWNVLAWAEQHDRRMLLAVQEALEARSPAAAAEPDVPQLPPGNPGQPVAAPPPLCPRPCGRHSRSRLPPLPRDSRSASTATQTDPSCHTACIPWDPTPPGEGAP
ncbi:hypothetical protein [Kitasatospora sp. NPDC002965]|uniref:hypothetical protein n=1 Tax=Kitasatospora sp. NPDC002965 TaxID=3154775 RepID=UPI0033A4F7D0